MKKHQKDYENYMKGVVDTFAKIVNYEGGESIICGTDNRISVALYGNKEYLLFYDTELKNLYDGKNPKEDVIKWRMNKQELGNKFLNENTLTYEEWVVKHK
jgi:hypothetical protein